MGYSHSLLCIYVYSYIYVFLRDYNGIYIMHNDTYIHSYIYNIHCTGKNGVLFLTCFCVLLLILHIYLNTTHFDVLIFNHSMLFQHMASL